MTSNKSIQVKFKYYKNALKNSACISAVVTFHHNFNKNTGFRGAWMQQGFLFLLTEQQITLQYSSHATPLALPPAP